MEKRKHKDYDIFNTNFIQFNFIIAAKNRELTTNDHWYLEEDN